MNNLKDIHNRRTIEKYMQMLFYQDVNEQFEGYTQRIAHIARIVSVVLSGCQ